jgi:hypothetical protein
VISLHIDRWIETFALSTDVADSQFYELGMDFFNQWIDNKLTYVIIFQGELTKPKLSLSIRQSILSASNHRRLCPAIILIDKQINF